MNNRLNFNRSVFALFLAFVSFSNVSLAASSTSDGELDLDTPVKVIGTIKTNDSASPAKPSSESDSSARGGSATMAAPPLPSAAAPKPATTTSVTDNDPKIEKMKEEIRKNPRNIKLIVALAEEFYKKGDYEKTTLLLWKQIDKLDRNAIILLIKAHQKKNEPGEMIRAANILVGKNEKDFQAYTYLGDAYHMQKKHKETLENYKKALEINEKYEPAYYGLAVFYDKDKPNSYELRTLYSDMIEKIGSKPEYWQRLCEIDSRDMAEASVDSCKQATIKDPTHADAFVYLGKGLRASGKEEEGIAVLKKAAKDFPKSELAQYTYGKILEDDKNTVDAMKFYKTGVEADDKAARSWLGLASTSFDLKKYEVSLIAYKNACKYDKKNAAAFRKATAILRNNHVKDWIDKFEAASDNCTF